MRDNGITFGRPAVGSTLLRRRLLKSFEHRSELLVLLAAPAGYGKTVLASQLAESREFHRAFWVDCSGEAVRPRAVVQTIAEGLHSTSGDGGPTLASPESPVDPELRTLLASLGQRPICLVLDDIMLEGAVDALASVVGTIGRLAAPGSTVVVTCREGPPRTGTFPAPIWIVEGEDLLLDCGEARSLSRRLMGKQLSQQNADRLHSVSGGHPALFSLLARHALVDAGMGASTQGAPASLSVLILSLAEQLLNQRQGECLYSCALLGAGTERDLEVILDRGDVADSLRFASQCMPLLRVTDTPRGASFALHRLAQDVLLSESFYGRLSEHLVLKSRAMELLEHTSRLDRLFFLAAETCAPEELPSVLRRQGSHYLDAGGVRQLVRCLDLVSVDDQVGCPEIILLHARAMLMQGDPDGAIHRASVAKELAQHAGDHRTHAEALLLAARLNINLGDPEESRRQLEEALQAGRDAADADLVSLVYSHLVICCGHLGRVGDATRYWQMAEERASDAKTSAYVRAFCSHAGSMVTGLLKGRWADMVEPLLRIGEQAGIPLDLRLKALNNASGALLHMGRIGQAESILTRIVSIATESGFEEMVPLATSGQACVAAARSEYSSAEGLLSQSLLDYGGMMEPGEDPAFLARWRRAVGDLDGALDAAESGLAWSGDAVDVKMWRYLAEIERGSSLLALGDAHMAQTVANTVRSSIAGLGASYHEFVVDLVLAEIARQQGRTEEAVARLLEHSDYVLTESANLVMAFYVRAFPGLLGILARAVGPARLPAHMLRLVTGDDADRALRASWREMGRGEWMELAERLVGAETAAAVVDELEGGAPCRVRLFGGLEVDTPDGTIPDRAWRKRKARLLFAMLVAKRGHDVPREQILEYLWPDMSEDKARNNFYVIWNTLKGALSPNLPKGENCPFVESVGGLCRIAPELVSSDLDDFETLLTAARDAEASEDSEEAIAAYRRLEEIYRGELLPGDIYDDWFGSLRERCRQQFGDAMLQAARLHDQIGQTDATLLALRRGLDQDPLREDLYQELLRCQIDAGQRSAAIETYLACRSNLAEELGLDPSGETRHLYDQVLAMEEATPSDG